MAVVIAAGAFDEIAYGLSRFRLQREFAKAERKRHNFLQAIVWRQVDRALVTALAECQQRIEALQRQLAELQTPAVFDQLTDEQLERDLTERAAH